MRSERVARLFLAGAVRALHRRRFPSLRQKRRGPPSAVVTAYCIYLCYGALASEPATYACNPHAGEARTRPAEAVNAAMTLAGLAYSALRAGSSDLFDTGARSNPTGGGSSDTVALVGQDGCDSDEELAAGASAEAFPAGPVSKTSLVVPRHVRRGVHVPVHDARGMGRR